MLAAHNASSMFIRFMYLRTHKTGSCCRGDVIRAAGTPVIASVNKLYCRGDVIRVNRDRSKFGCGQTSFDIAFENPRIGTISGVRAEWMLRQLMHF